MQALAAAADSAVDNRKKKGELLGFVLDFFAELLRKMTVRG